MHFYVLAAEATGGAPAPNGYFIPHDPKELLWGSISFTIVMGLLAWKLGPVIKKALSDSKQNAIDEATSADAAMAEAQQAEAALRAELGDPESASQQIIADAHEAANQLRVDQNARTQDMVNSMWERAQNEVGSLGAAATSDLSSEVSSKALTAAEAVVAGNLDNATQMELIEDYIAKVGSA